MNWTVMHPDTWDERGNTRTDMPLRAYDVVVRRGGQVQRVELVRSDGEETIRLGAVQRSTSGLTPYWWAMGYCPGYLDPNDVPREIIMAGEGVESAEGFATRRYAIEHMLRRTGWYPKR